MSGLGIAVTLKSGVVTWMTTGAEVAAVQFASPEYLAVIVFAPAASTGASVARIQLPLPVFSGCGVPIGAEAAPATES